MCNGINELAGSFGKALEAAPDLYDDALKSTVQETGKTLSRIPRLINAVLAPLDIWILNKEYNIEETKKLLAKKLENVEPEKIVSPESYVAVPALQAISYSMNSEELRNMYANLLANSMNSDTKDSVHPAFVEIIKQLSPLEAKLLKSFSLETDLPIITIHCSNDVLHRTGFDCFKHILSPEFGINIDNYTPFAVAIDNLIRLNLILVDYDSGFTDKALYDPILNSKFLAEIKERISSFETNYYCINKNGTLTLSYLGQSFTHICII